MNTPATTNPAHAPQQALTLRPMRHGAEGRSCDTRTTTQTLSVGRFDNLRDSPRLGSLSRPQANQLNIRASHS